MISLNFLLLIASSSSIFASSSPVMNRHLGIIPTPSRYYLPKPPCNVIPLSPENEGRFPDSDTRPVYEVTSNIDELSTTIHQRLPLLDTDPEKFTRIPRVQLGEFDWRARKTNKKYPFLAVSPLPSQYATGYSGINSADVNVDTPRVYSYITVNNIHNNRPFGQYKWTRGFDSDPSGNNSR